MKKLQIDILNLIVQTRNDMDAKNGPLELNPHGLDEWSDMIKEQSTNVKLWEIYGDRLRTLNEVLKLAGFCVACLEEHIGKELKALMPEDELNIQEALKGAHVLKINPTKKAVSEAS
ncbi:MAG: hypothetical protein ROO71_08910 [Balneola sp.]